MTDYKRKKKRKRRFLYADQGISACKNGVLHSVKTPFLHHRNHVFHFIEYQHNAAYSCANIHTKYRSSRFNEIANLTTTVSE